MIRELEARFEKRMDELERLAIEARDIAIKIEEELKRAI